MIWNIEQSFLSLDPLAINFPNVSDYTYVLGNPIILIDPDGRNPVVSSFEEHVTNSRTAPISWTKKAINIFIGNSNLKKRDGSEDWGISLSLRLASQASAFSSMGVIQARNLDHAYEQLKNYVDGGGVIGNLIFDSHGTYRSPSFKVGSTKITSSNVGKLAKFKDLLNESSEVLILACHVGATHNKGDKFLVKVAKTLNAPVYGSRSWTVPQPLMFTGVTNLSMNDPTAENRELARANVGIWTRVTKGSLKVERYEHVGLYPNGSIMARKSTTKASLKKLKKSRPFE